MTSPRHLDTSICSYSYNKIGPITDVETGGVGVISSWRTYSTALAKPWTDLGGNLFKSYVDDAGHWMDVLMTRISATNIEFRVRDHKGHTIITRRFQIDAGGTNINIWAGSFFIRLESLRATSECMTADLLETSPDDVAGYTDVITAGAYRNSADTADGSNTSVAYLYMWESDGGAVVLRQDRGAAAGNWDSTTNRNQILGDGSLIYMDAMIETLFNGVHRQLGRMYHAFYCDGSIGLGNTKTLPVDDNTTATFQCSQLSTVNIIRLMYRKSDP